MEMIKGIFQCVETLCHVHHTEWCNKSQERLVEPWPFCQAHILEWWVDKPVQISCVGQHYMEQQCNKFTFIKALELSPVHWMNPLPCGKQCRPVKDSAREILESHEHVIWWCVNDYSLGLPTVDFIKDLLGLFIGIGSFDVVTNPGHGMILECAFYQLMQNIWWQ